MSPPTDDPSASSDPPTDTRTRVAFAAGLFLLLAFMIIAGYQDPDYSATVAIAGALISGILGLLATGKL
jgi:hypothetical protein